MRIVRRCLLALSTALLTGGAAAKVVLHDEKHNYRLSNGTLGFTIRKNDGKLTAMTLHGRDLLAGGTGYWSIVARSGGHKVENFGGFAGAQVTIDPETTGGRRAEVALRFRGTGADGGFPGTFETRYSLEEHSTALRVAGVLGHGPGDRMCDVIEARYVLKLDPDLFDHLSIDRLRDRAMPRPADWEAGVERSLKEARLLTTGRFAGRVEHKYSYSAILADLPAYGWCGTRENHGVWMINPSAEYISGGCTKMELTGHLDVGSGARPTLLNMWHGSHYGGTVLRLDDGESWSKAIGPFTIFCNAGSPPDQLWNAAVRAAVNERAAWPFDWFDHPSHAKSTARGAVAGTLRIVAAAADDLPLGPARVGLTSPDHADGNGGTICWQRDGRNPQFWGKASKDGRFRIGRVPAGTYVLRAFVDGIPGEFARADVTVKAGGTTTLGDLVWTPERTGKTLWQIGVADRSAAEFRHGDRFWVWGNHLAYREAFPQGVDFDVRTGDPAKDWHICQPLDLDTDGKVLGPGVWKIRFDCGDVPAADAMLRIGFCGTRAGSRLDFALNGERFAGTGPLPEAGVMHRDSHRGWSFERRFEVPARLLREKDNELTLTLHGRAWHQGVLYDFLRMEIPADGQTVRNDP